jgi:hypothetical protein
MKSITFIEEQKFTQWYIWLFPMLGFAVWLYAFVMQVVLNQVIGTRPATNIEIILVGFLPISLLILFNYIKLKTIISNEALHVILTPFCSKKIKLIDIQDIKIIKYDFVGFGCRFGSKYGVVYIINGNLGLQIITKYGERFLVGSQKIDDIKNHLNLLSISYEDQIK